jgi:ribosomal protein S18 acetylase RimI-like enzyme
MMPREITYRWRGSVTDAELADLTAAHGGHPEAGWWDRVRPHCLGWVTARSPSGDLIGFVNVAWDGGDHAFLLNTKVHPACQRRGIATEVVRRAADQAKAAGCEWLHVDFEEHLAAFYLIACDFRRTQAGLIHLPSRPA